MLCWVATFMIIIFGTITVGWQGEFYVSMLLTAISMFSFIMSLLAGRKGNESS